MPFVDSFFFAINYMIVLDRHHLFTPFAGFGTNLLHARGILAAICQLPQSAFETHLSGRHILAWRCETPSSYLIVPVEVTSFQLILDSPYLFTVCIARPNHIRIVEETTRHWTRRPLIVCTDRSTEHISLGQLGRDRLRSYIESIKPSLQEEIVRILERNTDGTARKRFDNEKPTTLQAESARHLTTDIVVNAIRSLGYEFSSEAALRPSTGDLSYEHAIAGVNRILNGLRQPFSGGSRPSVIWNIDMILTTLPAKKNIEVKNIGDKVFRTVLRRIQHQEHYSLSDIPAEAIKNDMVGKLLYLRREETELYTNIMSLVCASHVCPTIRVKPSIENSMKLEINNLISSNRIPHNESKICKSFNNLCTKVSQLISDEFKEFIPKDHVGKIKIYSDAPLEYLRQNESDLCPILMNHAVCRVPVTPGNLFAQSALANAPLFLKYSELTNVLIIRSFDRDDLTRDMLKTACDRFFGLLRKGIANEFSSDSKFEERVKYQIQDVASVKDILEALRSTEARIVVFDCHGSHSRSEEYGSLQIGTEQFNAWQHRGEIVVPPIVLLSACETHPIHGDDASVANGFLAAGAKCILATTMAVEAWEAAMFIARTIYRINDYFPAVLNYRRPYPATWLEFISGMQKMWHSTAILNHFVRRYRLSKSSYHQIQFAANTEINSNRPGWFDSLLVNLEKQTGLPRDEIAEQIRNNVAFSDAMKYVLIGNADRVFIVDDAA